MPPDVLPFADSTHATLSLFRPDSTIPPRTHITAIVGGIGGLPTNNTTTTFKALLHGEVPNDGQATNDYVLPKDAGTTKCSFKLQFGYSAEQATRVDDAFEQVDRSREALAVLIKSKEPFTVDLSGARVLSFSLSGNTWTAEVDALGQRTYTVGDGKPQQLLPAMDSSPTWWPTPAPSSPPSSAPIPSPEPSQGRAMSMVSPNVSNRLRPITTLPIPPPPPAQPKKKSSLPNVPAPAPQPALTSAHKRPPSPVKQVSPAKRPRNDTGRDSSDIGSDALTTFPPRNGFVGSSALPHTDVPARAMDCSGESGLLIIKEKSRKISAPKKRMQVDAQRVGGMEHDDDDVFGLHEDTRSERLEGYSLPPTPLIPEKSLGDQPIEGAADRGITSRASSKANGHQVPSTARSVADAGVSRTSTEGRDAFLFVTGRRSRVIEAQRREAAAREAQPSQRDRTAHPRLDSVTLPKTVDTENAIAGPFEPASIPNRVDNLERVRKEQARLEAEAKAAEMREVERERVAQQRASVFGLPVHLEGITYTPLAKLKSGEKKNFMGVVLEPPNVARQVGGGDWVITVVLVDPTSPGHERKLEGTAVTLFRAKDTELPIVYPGMVVALRGVKCSFYKEKIKGNLYKPTARDTNSWAYMKKNGTTTSSDGAGQGEGEMEHMRKLRDWWAARTGPGVESAEPIGSQASSPDRGQGKMKPLGSLVPGTFSNVTVKILAACHNTRGAPLDLYVTDGTVNPRPTRNFREMQNGTPPSSIWTISIFDALDPETAQHFTDDAFVVLRNVLVKAHSQTEELEMKWSNRLPEEQVERGWKAKPVTPVPRGDYRATQINQRINQLKKQWAENPAAFDNMPIPPQTDDADRSEYGQRIAPPRLSDEVAKHVGTIHTDPIRNLISTLAEVSASRQAPNKWRFRARVKALRPRQAGRGENNYVVWYCTRCDRRFDPPGCQACSDPELSHAELRYWIWAELEDSSALMSVIIANEAAAEFLPPLPPLVGSTNPNDRKKMDTRVREANRAVEDMLLGATMDGQRSRPVIDWSVETVEQELVHAGGWKRVIKHLVMGMKSR